MNKTNWMPVSKIVDMACIDDGDDAQLNRQKYNNWIIRGYKKLRLNLLRQTATVLLKVNPHTGTAKLPDNYKKYMTVAYFDGCGDMVDVPLVAHVEVEEKNDCTCERCSSHALCGSAIYQRTEEVINMNGTDYTKSVTTFLDKRTGIYKSEVSEPVFIDGVQFSGLAPYEQGMMITSYQIVDDSITMDVTLYGALDYPGTLTELNNMLRDGIGPSWRARFEDGSLLIESDDNTQGIIGFKYSTGAGEVDFVLPDSVPQVKMKTKVTDLCQLDILPCGCVAPTEVNYTRLQRCCCCTALEYFAKTTGQRFCADHYFTIDEENGFIHVSPGIVKILLKYRTEMPCVDGNIYVPEISAEYLTAFALYKQDFRRRKSISDVKLQTSKENMREEKRELIKNIMPIRTSIILNAMRLIPS